jgi:hypothetical protein
MIGRMNRALQWHEKRHHKPAASRIDDGGRLAKALAIVAFFVVVFLPGVQMVTGLGQIAPVPENRRLAEWPAFNAEKGLQAYIEAGQSWFDDHFGFRAFFIRLKTQIDYTLFDYSSRIHIGKDGWLFYRSVHDVEKPNVERILARSDDQVVAGAVELNRILARRGITLVLLIAPLKDHFYSEFLPNSVQRLPKPSRFEELYERLRRTNGLLFIDAISLLRETAKQRPIFHKTDFHWNDPAAFVVAKWVVDELSRRGGRQNSVWTHELKVVARELSGLQATFMPLFSSPRETALFVDPTWRVAPPTYRMDIAPYEWVSQASQLPPDVLAPMAVLGDSFFDGLLRSGIMLEFEKVYRASWLQVRLPEFLAKLPADCRYVMIEFMEVNVPGLSDLADMAPRK